MYSLSKVLCLLKHFVSKAFFVVYTTLTTIIAMNVINISIVYCQLRGKSFNCIMFLAQNVNFLILNINIH